MKLPTLTRTRAVVAVIAVVAIAGGTAGGVAYAHHDDLPADAVFRYAGRTVTQDDLHRRVEVLSALYGVRQPIDAAKLDQFNRDAAKSMAVGMVLQHATDDQDIVVSDKQARDQLDKLVGQQLAGGQQQFTDFLASSGISEADVLGEIKEQLATSDLAQKVTGSVPVVTEEMARQTYDSRRDQMVSPEQRHLLNIVVTSNVDAERVLAAARRGTPFAALAATWSRDGSSKDRGGDIGTHAASDLDPAYAAAAFAARQGALFGPVRTQFGWNVGKVAGVIAPVPVSFAKMKASLEAAMLDKEKLDAWSSYLTGLLQAAHVQYADAYRPANPTSLPSGVPTAAAQ